MDIKEFWKLIETSNENSEIRASTIVAHLKEYSPEQIVAFEIILRQYIIEADDFKIMAAAKIIQESVSDDSYLYFRCWLISQGEKTFLGALKNPDTLADKVNRDSETDFEDLIYVSTDAFRSKTGKSEEDETFPRDVAYSKGLDYDFGAPPTKGTDWTIDELPKLYPKLWAIFN